ncbi:Toll-like receptor 6 [Gryllus bimaculatus]|nr:Toll-like receptor 6 [Gryllus bimaculatus]
MDEFCSWKKLHIFRIANNRISELKDLSRVTCVYEQRSYLQHLDLSGNPLHTISPSAFSSMHQLETLDLSDTGHLAALADDTFSALGRLRHLRLAGNRLARVSSGLLAPLHALESLQLQRNALAHLPADALRAQTRLRVLNLDSNLLEALQPHLFARLHSLQHLSARDNRLAAVPSLRLCACPLRTALFAANAIAAADEAAVRALWRPGFELGDLRGNLLSSQAWQWVGNASDVTVSTQLDPQLCSDSRSLWTIRLKVGYGFIRTCV